MENKKTKRGKKPFKNPFFEEIEDWDYFKHSDGSSYTKEELKRVKAEMVKSYIYLYNGRNYIYDIFQWDAF